jgi:AraC-like DNA-binding protein
MSTPFVGKPRGILRPAPAPGTSDSTRAREPIELERRAPDADLAPFVEHFWTVAWDLAGSPCVREVLPHPSVHIVLERGSSRVAGVVRGRFTRTLEGRGRVFGIKFLPGGFRPWVDFPIARLTDKTASLVEILGEDADSLEGDVFAEATMSAMIGRASTFLRAHLPALDPMAKEVAAIAQRIMTDRSIRMARDVAHAVGRSERALQRLFGEYVGVSPKWVIRRYRLHEAIERIDEGAPPDWAALATDLGYFDQAHFIRDFKALVGKTPGEYLRTPR